MAAVSTPHANLALDSTGRCLVAGDRQRKPCARYVAQARAVGWPVQEILGGHRLMRSHRGMVVQCLLDATAAGDS